MHVSACHMLITTNSMPALQVGLTGFKCRGCDYTFCGGHRIPEAHHCAGLEQFKEQGRAQLQKANPVVQAAKINKV